MEAATVVRSNSGVKVQRSNSKLGKVYEESKTKALNPCCLDLTQADFDDVMNSMVGGILIGSKTNVSVHVSYHAFIYNHGLVFFIIIMYCHV